MKAFAINPLSCLGVTSLELANNLLTGFRYTLYEKVSDGAVISYLNLPAALTAIIFVMFPAFLLIRIIVRHLVYKRETQEDQRQPDKGEEELTGNHIRISISSILVIVYLFAAFQYLYTAKAASFVEKSMDILAPHVSENKGLVLRADYRSIKDSKGYFSLYSELRNLEKEYSVVLPEFEPI